MEEAGEGDGKANAGALYEGVCGGWRRVGGKEFNEPQKLAGRLGNGTRPLDGAGMRDSDCC